MTRLEAIRARRAIDGDMEIGWFVAAERDRAWLLARVDALAEALRDVRYDAHGHVDDSPCGHEYCQRAAVALQALSEDEST